MKYIDLSCPAEIFRTAMPTEEIPAATLTLFNLCDRVIVSVEVSLRLLDADGGETERLAFRGRALNGRPHSTFLLTVPCAPSEGVRSIDAVIEKVWYADNEVWRRDSANSVEYTPNALPVSPALTNLKYAAGETAVGFPSLQKDLWVCVCGRPNPKDSLYCARCGRQMETVFSLYSPEAVETQVSMKERQLELNSRNMREDTIRLQRIREDEYMKKKARRGSRIRTVIAMAACVALAAGAMFYGSPWLRLAAGRQALSDGDPAGAKEIFRALGSFGNAEEMVSECDWQMALNTLDEGSDAEALGKASRLLRKITDRPEAEDKANEMDFMRARLLLEQGKWSEALSALYMLPEDYAGREELEQKALMAKGLSLKERGKYDDAREVFLSLGDYPDARTQAAECLYEPAQEMMEQEDWDGVINRLSTILDYKNSRDMTLESHYHKAEALYDAGDLEGASREFLLAGGWSDALERCKELTYAQAEALLAAGDRKGAQSLFASIPDYRDANDRDREIRYLQAEDAADDREYTKALELLQDIPDGYRNTYAIRTEAMYEKAKTAVRQEDWTTAVELLGSLDRNALKRKYRDIETLYLNACENAGVEPYPEETAVPENAEESASPAPEATPAAPSAEPDPFLVTED